MKMNWKVAAVLVLTAVFGVGTFAFATGTQDKIDDVQQSLDAFEQEKQEAENILAGLEQKKEDIEEYISLLEVEMGQIAKEIETVQNEVSVKEQEIAKAEAELAGSEISRTEQYEAMKLRIQYLYESGESDYLEIILSAGSFADMMNEIEYISQLSEYDKNRMAALVETEESIAAFRAQLEADRQILLAKQEEVSAKQEALTLLREAKNEEMLALNDAIDASGDKVDGYEGMIEENEILLAQLQAQLEREMEEARKIAESLAAAEASKAEESRRQEEESKRLEEESKNEAAGGKPDSSESSAVPDSTQASPENALFQFVWPVPDSHRVTSPFGPRPNLPVAGANPFHNAIDIGAPEGSDIVAVADGVVIYVGDGKAVASDSGGLQVWISHDNGRYITTYMHASKLIAKQGQTVKAGDVIAEVGSTGASTGNHLDFRIMYNGGYVDPLGDKVVYIK